MTKPLFSLVNRPDTFLGVCEGLGEDFGVNANLFRLAFGVAVLFSPVVVISIYVALGVLAALTRWAYPSPVRQPEVAPASAPLTGDNDAEQADLPLAA